MATTSLIIILILSVIYGYMNGLLGSANVVATMLSSRAMGPRPALVLAAVGMTVGPFLLGVAVANTIGAELIDPRASTSPVMISALAAAIVWTGITMWLKIPSSISQALIGGLIGAVVTGYGHTFLYTGGLFKVLLALFLSPILGLFVALILVRLLYFLAQSATPRINVWFNRGQTIAALLMAISFGANDGQKVIAMMALGLLTTGFTDHFVIPEWIIILSALSVGLGTLMGGWRLIRTLGARFYKIRPIHGFGAQLASGAVIFGAALLGGPVSGTQVVTTAIVGAGSADRIQKVRWGVMRQILIGWILTIPLSAVVSALCYKLVERVMMT